MVRFIDANPPGGTPGGRLTFPVTIILLLAKL